MRLILLALSVLFALAKPSYGAETLITILTANAAGGWYPLGTTLSSIYSKAIPGANITVQATQGSVENLRSLEAGEGELGFTLADTLASAVAGDEEAGFSAPLVKVRGVASLFPIYVHLYANDQSGIKTLADLKGKRVSLGAQQSGSALNSAAILKAAGLTLGDLAKAEHLPFATAARMVEQGALDAAFQTFTPGGELLRHLLATGKISLIPIPPEVIEKIGNPAYIPGTIPADTYEGQRAAVRPPCSSPEWGSAMTFST